MSGGMFPPRMWAHFGGSYMPIQKGSDEWGRHTLVLGFPFVAHIVIAGKPCGCEDMAEFACTFPGCPYLSMVAGEDCMTHDREFWAEESSSTHTT